MDETMTPLTARTGTDDVADVAGRVADQPALPLGAAYADDADEPIGYSLTARARRQVAPHALPALRVVEPLHPDGPGYPDDPEGDGALDRPGDTRPSRARALRRAGVPSQAIAAQLAVDELVVRAWVDDVPVARRRRATVGHGHTTGASPGTDSRLQDGERRVTAMAASVRQGDEDVRHTAFQAERAGAAAEARERLGDAGFVGGLGLVSGILGTDGHAVTLTTDRIEVAAAAVHWLVARADLDPRRLRIVLRLGADAAGDLARHRWAAALGVGTDRVLHARWRGAPTGDAVEALLRIPDPALAARLAGWRDALLSGPTGAAEEDAGF